MPTMCALITNFNSHDSISILHIITMLGDQKQNVERCCLLFIMISALLIPVSSFFFDELHSRYLWKA